MGRTFLSILRSTGEACSVGSSTAELVKPKAELVKPKLFFWFKLFRALTFAFAVGVVGLEPALLELRTRLTGPLLFVLMAQLLLLLVAVVTGAPPTMTAEGDPFRGSEPVVTRLGRGWTVLGRVISRIGSKFDLMGEPSRLVEGSRAFVMVTPAADACKTLKHMIF